jgi:hypothetical protein
MSISIGLYLKLDLWTVNKLHFITSPCKLTNLEEGKAKFKATLKRYLTTYFFDILD